MLVLIVLATSVACSQSTPEHLGVSNARWQRMSLDDQRDLLEHYETTRLARKNLATAQRGIEHTAITVRISGGQLILPASKTVSPYHTVTTVLTNGECGTVDLHPLNHKKIIRMRLCYQKNRLYLDPKPYGMKNWRGSVVLQHHPLWRRGFIYRNVNTHGQVHLRNANVKIQDISSS